MIRVSPLLPLNAIRSPELIDYILTQLFARDFDRINSLAKLPGNNGGKCRRLLFVSYGIGLFDNENIISARYDLARGFGLKATSGQKSSGFDFIYRIER